MVANFVQLRSDMNVLVSSCFILPTRYDGSSQNKPETQAIIELLQEHSITIIPVCPEQLGGLSTPRLPAEICGDEVIDIAGNNLSAQFKLGAQSTLAISRLQNIDFAILKQGSPSCGSKYIYDGSHSNTKISGQGITTKYLQQNEIDVYSEHDIDLIKDRIWKLKI